MRTEDRKEFVRVLNGLAAIKHVDLTEEAYDLWWQSMNDWQIDDFRQAAGYLLKNCHFMPAPKDFEDIRKKSVSSAYEAWADAKDRCLGWRNAACTSGDALTDRVVGVLGGYREIALCDHAKLVFMEKRFIEIYNDFAEGDQVRAALPNLASRPALPSTEATPIGEVVKKLAATY